MLIGQIGGDFHIFIKSEKDTLSDSWVGRMERS